MATYGRMVQWVRDQILPSWWTNSIQDRIAAGENIQLRTSDATTVQLVAGAEDERCILNIQGRWRYVDASITRAHPGGAAGTFKVFVVAADNNVTNSPDPNTDHTVYSFELRVTTGANPTGVDLFRQIGSGVWDGDSIESIKQTVGVTQGSRLADDVLASDGLDITRQPNGGFLLEVGDGEIGPDQIAADAVITAKILDLNVTAAKIAAGAITAAKVNDALKPSVAASAGTEALRALGTSGSTAAAGNDSRLSDARAASSIPAAVRLTDMHLHDVYASMPAASSGLNGVRFIATDKGMEWECIAGAWVLMNVIPLEVTSLPGSPITGQEIYLKVDTGGAYGGPYRWHCRYDSGNGGTYKWDVIEVQADLFATSGSLVNVNTTTAVNLNPTITCPISGYYEAEAILGCQMISTMEGMVAGFSVGGTPSASLAFFQVAQNEASPVPLKGRYAVGATQVIRPWGAMGLASRNVYVSSAQMWLRPLRV